MVHSACTYSQVPKEYSVDELAAFHGHIGPILILGYRIGRYALKNLGGNPLKLKATVYYPKNTPEMCLADGVQLGSGCTLGKANIEIIDDSDVRCEFTCGTERIVIRPLVYEKPPRDENYESNLKKLAEKIFNSRDNELFVRVNGKD